MKYVATYQCSPSLRKEFEAESFAEAAVMAADGSLAAVASLSVMAEEPPSYDGMLGNQLGRLLLQMPDLPVFVSFQGRRGVDSSLFASIEVEEIRERGDDTAYPMVHLFLD